MKRSEIEPDKRFGWLSKGVQHRLAFALAAATGSELLLDEPPAGVEPFARRELPEDIFCFMQDGDRTIVFATHVIEEVRRVADYAVFHLARSSSASTRRTRYSNYGRRSGWIEGR
jgi:ABC-2 type transport system ATP-binding protein